MPSHAHRALRVEPLEDRRLLAVIAIDSLADGPVSLTDGNMTLRDALALAADAAYPGADEIVFAASLGLDTSPGEIELLEGELLIASDVTITGPGASNLAIDADADDDGTGESRVFYVNSGVTAVFDALSITGGFANDCGGGIYSYGTLTILDSSISGNRTNNIGGGVFSFGGALAMSGCSVSGNQARNSAGGVYGFGVLTISTSNISDNSGGGGGGINGVGTVVVIDSTISHCQHHRLRFARPHSPRCGS